MENKKIRYLSVFSGMEAATVAWHHIGWTPVGFSEIEPFPSQILKHHYPTITNYGDITKFKQWPIERGSIDLLVGGSPCQAFSVAGLRQGLADPRGNLALVFLGLADHLRPKYILWENVPGVLSSNKGEDFASFISALAEFGYGFAWRVCDAQYFGVPQRRKRVFLLAIEGAGNWRTAAEILFERKSLCGDIEESDKEGEVDTADVGTGIETGRKRIALYENRPTDSRITGPLNVAPTMTSRFGTGGGNIPLVNLEPITFQPGNLRRDAGADPSTEATTTLKATAGDQMPHIAYAQGVDLYNQELTGDVHCPLRTAGGHGAPATLQSMAVRRLTPVECERLQGFPDNYSQIPWKGKSASECPDGPRYKACGNSMAVPVMRWIGERIQKQIEQKL
jgi:DNA (cytosine-5)-methyltransferase 1